jgi:AcrR family transcriptional regulator
MSRRVDARRELVAHAGREGAHVQEMQRRRLLLAMVEVVSEHGFEGAGIARICKRASVSRRTFYEIFEDREGCLLAAFDQAIERIAGVLVPAFTGEGRWCERIRGALVALLEFLDAEPGVARMCIVEALKAGPAVSERRARILTVLVGAVEQGRLEARRANEPPPLAGQGVVGGALWVVHARLLELSSNGDSPRPLIELTGSLMGMIVHPYLGSEAARRELERPAPTMSATITAGAPRDPFKGLSIRFTYRTARVLGNIAADPGASNRLIADTSGVTDEGQMSRLLTRLERSGLIENLGEGQAKGEPNAWVLTEKGREVQGVIAK